MAKRNRDTSELVKTLSRLGNKVDYDKGVEGMKEFPRILLEKSRKNIINKNYDQAKKDLKNYWKISKILEESINFRDLSLNHNYKIQRKIFNELASRGYFEGNGNEPERAYE